MMNNEPTTDPTFPVPAPAPPQSVRIETTLWWEEGEYEGMPYSALLHGLQDKPGYMAGVFPDGCQWKWKGPLKDSDVLDFETGYTYAPTREAAKAEALQAVMGAIGAREVGK